MSTERLYATKRQSIINALANKLKLINGTGNYLTNMNGNVLPRLKFWDEIEEFPAIHLNAGTETVAYLGGGYKDRFLEVTVRCYVNQEDAVKALDELLEDVETVVEENSVLPFTDKLGATKCTHQISVVSITTDEGVLEPIGVGEILLEVQY